MNYQRILLGAVIGTAVVGAGFMLFHPAGKKIRKKAMDLGLEAADKLIDYVRTTSHQNMETGESQIRTGASTVAREV